MIHRVFHKIKSNPNSSVTILLVLVSFFSLGIGLYNSYIIQSKLSKITNSLPSGGQNVALRDPKDLLKNISKDAPRLGNPDAKVVIVEFEDFQCPFCKKFENDTFPEIKAKYIDTNKVLYIHQDIAFLGLESNYSAQAAHCAQEQNKFWEYRDYLYKKQGAENSGVFMESNLKKYAENLGLDMVVFNSCYDSGKYKAEVSKSADFAKNYGVLGTPTFVINGQVIRGALGIEAFKNIIGEE